MKRLFTGMLAVLMAASCYLPASAAESVATPELMVVFAEDTAFTEEEQQRIIRHLCGEEHDGASTYNLLCNVFGHKYTTEQVTTISHCVYTSSPRCVENIYIVSTCSRCEDTNSTLNDTTRIYCCSEE